jgi:DNA-binding response OmpR family regulator
MSNRILAVDDDALYLAGLGELLTVAGYEVRLANTFEAAKHALDAELPDLLLVDVRLGAYNGLQLVSRTSSGPNRIPAIVVSGFDDAVLRADAAAFGARYMLKPIAAPTLLGLLAEMLPTLAR